MQAHSHRIISANQLNGSFERAYRHVHMPNNIYRKYYPYLRDECIDGAKMDWFLPALLDDITIAFMGKTPSDASEKRLFPQIEVMAIYVNIIMNGDFTNNWELGDLPVYMETLNANRNGHSWFYNFCCMCDSRCFEADTIPKIDKLRQWLIACGKGIVERHTGTPLFPLDDGNSWIIWSNSTSFQQVTYIEAIMNQPGFPTMAEVYTAAIYFLIEFYQNIPHARQVIVLNRIGEVHAAAAVQATIEEPVVSTHHQPDQNPNLVNGLPEVGIVGHNINAVALDGFAVDFDQFDD